MRWATLGLLAGCRLGFGDVAASRDAADDAPPGDTDTDAGAPTPQVLSMSNRGACAVYDDGELWCWGDNLGQALGAATTGFLAPTRIDPARTWVDVATGIHHSCGRTSDGALWCWGESWLGTGSAPGSTTPVQIGTATDWTAIAVNDDGACGLRAGALWCWGNNSYGEVGDTTTMPRSAPVPVMAGTSFMQVSTYHAHVCAIASDSSLYCWGLGNNGQLGNGGSVQNNPTPIHIGTDAWRAVRTGDDIACAIRSDGTLWCWGPYVSVSPLQIGSETDWSSIAAGSDTQLFGPHHMCGLRGTELWCMGTTGGGRVGIDSPTDIGNIAPVATDPGHTFTAIAASTAGTCGIRDGVIACTGRAAHGHLGDGPTRRSLSPQFVAGSWRSVDGGATFTSAVAQNGTLFAWGDSVYDEQATTAQHATQLPLQRTATPAWSAVTNGRLGAIALLGDSTVWRYGAQFTVNGGATNYIAPAQIGVATWTKLDGGSYHDCGIQTDQTLWCWGANWDGELGNNNTTPSATPIKVNNSTVTYSEVSAGDLATCGVRTAGTLWCWGNNNYGQLGIGNTNNQTVPTQIGSLTTWQHVSIGVPGACGIRTDGSLWCWGVTIGDGTTGQSTSPVHIGTATWAQVAQGPRHRCGVQTNGTLWCWGANEEGQLGDGTRSDQLAPVQVGTATNWSEVHVGWDHSCALTTANQLACWGVNDDGQLGDGKAWVTSFEPVVALP